MRNNKGFTLIELMIVLAIVAIVVSLVYGAVTDQPAYQDESNVSIRDTQTVSTADTHTLVCTENGAETFREPAIPGQLWSFSGGQYVTNDAVGNPRTVTPKGDCTIQTTR